MSDRNIKVDYNYYKTARRKQKKFRWSIVSLIIIIIFLSATSGFFVSLFTRFTLLNFFFALTPSVGLLPETNILVLGVDSVTGTHRSDTIMVVHLSPKDKEAKVISIPRDTIVVIPGRGLDKINHAYAYGGVDLAKETAAQLFSVPVPYYVLVDINGLAKIIDKLGGITID
ncbi:MAG: LCP family protein, partial [Candidatus Saganbacteria bacterium]|nr:LCP family protein [Candidatus Saganbacteria bacterium]